MTLGSHRTQHKKLGVDFNSSRVIAASATPRTFIGDNTTVRTAAKVTINPDDLRPESILRIAFAYEIDPTVIGTRLVRILVGGVSILQYNPNQTHPQFAQIEAEFMVSPDKTSLVLKDITPILSTVDSFPFWSSLTATPGAPATVNIDLNSSQDLEFQLRGPVGDTTTLHGFSVLNKASHSGAPSKTFLDFAPYPTACWGDSLTNGTGASSSNTTYPSVLYRVENQNRASFNGGAGGETGAQIAARALLDKVRGRLWTNIIWIGRNDLDGIINDELYLENVATIVDNMAHDRFLILSITNKGGTDITEQQGTAVYNEIISANNALAAAYPDNYLDIRALLVAVSTGATGTDCIGTSHMHTDMLHLNDTGYAYVADQVETFISAKGW